MSDSQGGQYIEQWRDASRTLHTPAPQYTDLVTVAQGRHRLTYGAERWREASRTPPPTQVGQTLHSPPAPQDGKDSHDHQMEQFDVTMMSGDGVQ